MYLSLLSMQLRARLSIYLQSAGVMVALLLLLTVLSPGLYAQGAASVSYTVSPATGSVQPNSTVDVLVTVRTEVAIAGASLHLSYTNGSYASFESAQSPSLSFVDYHASYDDLVFICNNNNCPPGTYLVATITARSSQNGSLQIGFTPKETVDPQLNPVSATGTSGTYTITSSAAASPKPKPSSKKTVTVPQDDGSGGIGPLQITNEQFQSKLDKAQALTEQVGEDQTTTFWTPLNLILVGLAVGAGFACFTFVLIRLFGGSGPKNPYNSGGSGHSGPTAIVG